MPWVVEVGPALVAGNARPIEKQNRDIDAALLSLGNPRSEPFEEGMIERCQVELGLTVECFSGASALEGEWGKEESPIRIVDPAGLFLEPQA